MKLKLYLWVLCAWFCRHYSNYSTSYNSLILCLVAVTSPVMAHLRAQVKTSLPSAVCIETKSGSEWIIYMLQFDGNSCCSWEREATGNVSKHIHHYQTTRPQYVKLGGAISFDDVQYRKLHRRLCCLHSCLLCTTQSMNTAPEVTGQTVIHHNPHHPLHHLLTGIY